MRKYLTLALLGFAALLVLSAATTDVAAQGLKVGWVNDQKIQVAYPDWARAEEQLRIEIKAWEDEAIEMQQTLQDLVSEYEKQKLILSEEKRAEREATIITKKENLDAYTRTTFGPGGKAEKRQESLMIPLVNKVTRAIEMFSEAEGYDVIFTNESGLGYINPSLEVTDQILEYLDKVEE